MTRQPWRFALKASSVFALACAFVALIATFKREKAASYQNNANGSVVTPPPTRIGINLGALDWFIRQRVFANLVTAESWQTSAPQGWQELPGEQRAPDGSIRALHPGQFAATLLAIPAGPFGKIRVRCTYKGNGAIRADGIARVAAAREGVLDLDMIWPTPALQHGWVQIDSVDPKNPLRQLDCRESAIAKDAVFAPAFVNSLRGFAAIRFLDWQAINTNSGGNWDRFVAIDGQFKIGQPEGARPETMIAAANAAGTDPWFLMPYNADARYIENFARTVHARLDPKLRVYVELGNEVWNTAFGGTRQAESEGRKEFPFSDARTATLRRYAEKSRIALDIWTRIFRDRPERLVRVVSTQNADPASAEMLLGMPGLAESVDALATAPYFRTEIDDGSDFTSIFARLKTAATQAIDLAAQNRAIAVRHGKRFIGYEGGQHLISENVAKLTEIERDPRMGEIYRTYLGQWRGRIGDLLVLFNQTGPVSRYGAWGLREYADQPPQDAPKWRAVHEFMVGR